MIVTYALKPSITNARGKRYFVADTEAELKTIVPQFDFPVKGDLGFALDTGMLYWFTQPTASTTGWFFIKGTALKP